MRGFLVVSVTNPGVGAYYSLNFLQTLTSVTLRASNRNLAVRRAGLIRVSFCSAFTHATERRLYPPVVKPG